MTAGDRRSSALRPRQVWAAGVIVACLALLAIVAVVSDGHPLDAGSSPGHLDLAGAARLLLALLGLAVVAGLVMLLVMASRVRPARRPRARTRRGRSWIVLLAAAVVFLFVLFRSHHDTPPEQPLPTATSVTDGGSSERHAAPLWAVAMLGMVGVVALGAAVAAGRRLRPEPELPEAATLLEAWDESLAALEADPDPRRRSSPPTRTSWRPSRRAAWDGGRPKPPSSTCDGASPHCPSGQGRRRG